MADKIFIVPGQETGQNVGKDKNGDGIGSAVGILQGLAGSGKEDDTEALGSSGYLIDFLRTLQELFPDTKQQMEEGGIETPQRNIFQDFLEKSSEQKKLLQDENNLSSLALPQIDLATLMTSRNKG